MNSSDLMWFGSIWFNLNYNLWSTSQHPSKSQEHRKHCTLLITTIVYFTPYITYSARPLTPSPLPFGSPLALSPLSILPWPCLSTYSLRLSSPFYPFSVGCRPHVPRLLCYPMRPGRCCTPRCHSGRSTPRSGWHPSRPGRCTSPFLSMHPWLPCYPTCPGRGHRSGRCTLP